MCVRVCVCGPQDDFGQILQIVYDILITPHIITCFKTCDKISCFICNHKSWTRTVWKPDSHAKCGILLKYYYYYYFYYYYYECVFSELHCLLIRFTDENQLFKIILSDPAVDFECFL